MTNAPLLRTLFLTLFLAAPAVAQDSLLDTFVSTLTAGTTSSADELTDVLSSCTPSTQSNDYYQQVLTASLNATRTCLRIDATRENAKACIDDYMEATRLITDPVKAFSTQVLTLSDMATLSNCADSVSTEADVVAAFSVLAKRYLGCSIDFPPGSDRRDTLLTALCGADYESHGCDHTQQSSTSLAALSSTCSILDFSAQTHRDIVDFVKESLHDFANVFPARRRQLRVVKGEGAMRATLA